MDVYIIRKNLGMKKLIVVLMIMVTAKQNYAQDLTFSQFYEQPLLRNPALAGVFDGDVRVKATFRNQWNAVTVPFQTGALSGELKMPIKNAANDWITIGMQITHDVAGDARLKRTSIQPAINYHKNLGDENFLSIAFMGGPVNTQFDPTRLKWDDQFVAGSYNPANPTAQVFNNTGYTYWDASVGLTYTGVLSEETRFYAGAALYHFNNPKLNFYSNNGQFSVLGRKYVVNAGLTTRTSDNNKIQVYADYFNQSGASQFLGGFLYGIEFINRYEDNKTVNLNLGAFFRWNDALIPVINFDFYDFTFGLSYDVNVSRLKAASQMQGGFELSATYRASLNRRSNFSDAVRCVRF